MKKVVVTLTIALLVLIFAVSAWMVGSYLVESRQQAKENEELANMVSKPTETQPTSGTTAATTVEGTFGSADNLVDANGVLEEYSEALAKYPDMVGWIRIDGTKLNYPVMQTPDRPNYYLDHNLNGVSSAWGAIYAREECDINKPSDNITLYGHHMRDGSMFACLDTYKYKKTWDNNPLIFFDTLHGYHVYKIFAVFTTSANIGEGFSYHQMIDAKDKKDFDDFIAKCKELSLYDTGVTPEYGDKTICLSTCEYSHDNGRLVVAAVRIS